MNTSKFPITTHITATPNFKGCAEQAQMIERGMLLVFTISTFLIIRSDDIFYQTNCGKVDKFT